MRILTYNTIKVTIVFINLNFTYNMNEVTYINIYRHLTIGALYFLSQL